MNLTEITSNVVVIGGGIAGISAALSAKRLGKNVVLCESTYLLGGLATSGLISIYLPLCDGFGNQVSYGIVEELIKLSVSLEEKTQINNPWFNPESTISKKDVRYEVKFNPFVFAILAEQLLINEGVKILYGINAYDVETKDNLITSILCCSRTDKIKIFGDTFIDTTGDATIANLSGVPTKLSACKNIVSSWYNEYFNNSLNLKIIGSCDYIINNQKSPTKYDGVSTEELTDFTIEGHTNILNDFIKNGAISSTHFVSSIPIIPEVRMTRSIVGVSNFNAKYVNQNISHSVGVFPSFFEKGKTYELPYECLINNQIRNLYVAGRCISVEDDNSWNIARVIPPCAVSGEAAGILAALFMESNKIDYNRVKEVLNHREIKVSF